MTRKATQTQPLLIGKDMLESEWQKSVDIRLQNLELRNAVDEVHRINVEKRLASIEDTLKWLVRLILGALMLGAIAYALRGGFSIASL